MSEKMIAQKPLLNAARNPKILFMGTSEFAVPALKTVIAHEFELIGIVTQPDRRSGRGKRLTPPPIKVVAEQHNLPVYQPEKVRQRDFIRTLERLAPDVIVVAAFGQLLPQSLLDIPPCGTINLHPSLLPKYRGAAPVQWALINGEMETGITLMLLDAGEDTGDIICAERMPIRDEDTTVTLMEKLACIGANLLVKVLKEMPAAAPPPATPQRHNEATHAPRLTKQTGCIDWHCSATAIHNLVRGTEGWPGAYAFFRENLRLKILRSLPCSLQLSASCRAGDSPPRALELQDLSSVPPGTIEIADRQQFLVATGEGMLQLLKVQPATKKAMAARDFVNGYQLKTGERFLPPQ